MLLGPLLLLFQEMGAVTQHLLIPPLMCLNRGTLRERRRRKDSLNHGERREHGERGKCYWDPYFSFSKRWGGNTASLNSPSNVSESRKAQRTQKTQR